MGQARVRGHSTGGDTRDYAGTNEGKGADKMGLALLSVLSLTLASGCASHGVATSVGADEPSAWPTIQSPMGTPRPPYQFTPEDEALLNRVQHGAFNFLWNAVDPVSGMVVDRTSVKFVSVAGVGFQLAAIPVGIERGWITRDQGEQRTLTILRSLHDHPGNRHEGLFYHFLEGSGIGPAKGGPETVVSTIDSALLFAGMMTAASYFEGEVASLADRMIDAANWSAFVSGDEAKPHERGFISLGWRPTDKDNPSGPGAYLPYYWLDSGDEHRLVNFLAVGAQDSSHGAASAKYFSLRRELGQYEDTGPFVWFPWSGALFTHFFAHCFIDYVSLGFDDPSALGVERRPRVDWWENARRAVRMHQLKAEANPLKLSTPGRNAWGLNASDCPSGYCVPGLFPEPLRIPGEIPGVDYVADYQAKDNWGDGTIAPYSAGCAILFDPARSIAAMRFMMELQDPSGKSLVWHAPETGGFGFRDAFNLAPMTGDRQGTTSISPWVATDCVSIDQGPLILCIENARTGRVSSWFMKHPSASRAIERLKLRATERK